MVSFWAFLPLLAYEGEIGADWVARVPEMLRRPA
jgi:hypothetical protein